MTWPVVVKNGPLLNQTLSCIKFDKFGTKVNCEIFICDQWEKGFAWAKEKGYSHALFVDSGTIFVDWEKWQNLVNAYPHSGLIAHLIWHPGGNLYAHDQCWFAKLDQFDATDFAATTVQCPEIIRSETNLHDDYTPLWVKPGAETTDINVTHFSQVLIAKQLRTGPVVNWNNAARNLKSFIYDGLVDVSLFQEYKNIAENQLWVFNNETVEIVKEGKLLSPGSGLYWLLNITQNETTEMQIVDISQVQIEFCKKLWEQWDGYDYGTFVWDFINANKLTHYELDIANLSQLERLKLKGKSKFIEYVNLKFKSAVDNDFALRWQTAKRTKHVKFYKGNFIRWVIDNNINDFDNIWVSNILDYKWTLLHTTVLEYEQFKQKLYEKQNKQNNV